MIDLSKNEAQLIFLALVALEASVKRKIATEGDQTIKQIRQQQHEQITQLQRKIFNMELPT